MQLEIFEDHAFQKRVWRTQRRGWIAVAALILMALAGLTGGGGPFAGVTHAAGPTRVEGPRVARRGASEELRVVLQGPGDRAAIDLDPRFLRAFELVSTRPAALAQAATPQGLRLLFAVAGAGERTVTVTLRPRQAGWRRAGLAVDGRPVTIAPLVLP